MFRNHNIFTAFAVFLILMNCGVEIYSLASINTVLHIGFDYNFYRALMILLLLVISVIATFYVLLKRIFALKLCLVIYLIQIFGLIYNETYYILSYGLWISWSTDLSGFSIEINLVSLCISAVLFMAIRSSKKDVRASK